MLKTAYKVLHTDIGDKHRNACFGKARRILAGVREINSPTIYLKNFAEADEYLKTRPELKFVHIPAREEGQPDWPSRSGIIGVWASNYEAWMAFLETDADVLYIFEDDASISPNYDLITKRYIQELPEDWDFFSTFVPRDCYQWYEGEPDTFEIGAPNVCKNYQDWSCAAYVVSRAGIQKVLGNIAEHGISDPIDYYMFNVSQLHNPTIKFNTYTIKPGSYKPVGLNDQAAWFSSIGDTEVNYA